MNRADFDSYVQAIGQTLDNGLQRIWSCSLCLVPSNSICLILDIDPSLLIDEILKFSFGTINSKASTTTASYKHSLALVQSFLMFADYDNAQPDYLKSPICTSED